MSKRYVCVHGHFYQPPRENPWLGMIEPQPSAHPYRDWNVRILAECYRPNTAARILDEHDEVRRVLKNYSLMSFNFGPTLLSWIESYDPEVHDAIVDADKDSITRFGHGSAMAQAFNHVIMPLADDHDRNIQVEWGIRDFRQRFGRAPQGMWLPETAVDTASLEVLAAHGIEFTVLAPHQARRHRRMGETAWSEKAIDTRHVYRANLPSGRSIDLFFYDGPISHDVAFNGLLNDGHTFAKRLIAAADGGLCHIATDGESYGHHHPHGEMALAYALDDIERSDDAELINYAACRARFPADHEVEIAENTSWSCSHGVERWRSNCGCNSGGKPTWHQRWRAPLRDALDWLRDETRAINGRVNQDIGDLHLYAQLMYTSCGWFFDDVSGIETVQILEYASRLIELAETLGGVALEAEFLDRLADIPSNMPNFEHGRRVYETLVRKPQTLAERANVG